MTRCTPVGEPGRRCEECRRPLVMLHGRLQHKRGRPQSRRGNLARGRAKARAMRNVKPGHCECGQALATHDPVPEPPEVRSWHSQRNLVLRMNGAPR